MFSTYIIEGKTFSLFPETQLKSFPNVSLEKSLGQRGTTWDRSTRKFFVIPHPVSATSAGGLTIRKNMSICSKNVKALAQPERCERHENSENIQCYFELDGGMLRPEVYEIFKSPKPFQALAGWSSDFGLHILVDTSSSVMNLIQSCFNKYALQTYYYFLTYFPQSSTIGFAPHIHYFRQLPPQSPCTPCSQDKKLSD